MKYNFSFWGSPTFAKIILQGLLDNDFAPSVLVCNPDRPFGRKKEITPPPTKEIIKQSRRKIEILQPQNKEEIKTLAKEKNISQNEFAVVAAYSFIIPDEIIKLFTKGMVGVHPSLLPKYRGASPIQSAILNGEKETGVTLFLMDEKMDHGAVIAQEKLAIGENENYHHLEERLAILGTQMIIKYLPKYLDGMTLEKQSHEAASFTKKFKTEDGLVDLEKDEPMLIHRKVMALNPNPGVYAVIDGKRTKITESKVTNSGEIYITKIIPEGKKERIVSIKIHPKS